MNRNQRKLHSRMWLVLLLLILTGFISALFVIPEQSTQENIFLETPLRLSQQIKKHNSDNVIVILRSNEAKKKYQLEVIITTPFAQPEVGVYASNESDFDIKESKWLGSLSTKKANLFALPEQATREHGLNLILYDPIRKQILEKIQFEL